MPIYEYRCDEGHVFDAIQRFSDEPLDECEVCGAPAQKVLYPPAVHFKGSGFYNTDYGTRKRAREKEAADASSSKSESSPDGKSSSTDSSGSSSDSSGSSSGSSSDKPGSASKKPAAAKA